MLSVYGFGTKLIRQTVTVCLPKHRSCPVLVRNVITVQCQKSKFLTPNRVIEIPVRHGNPNYFNRLTANALWDSVTGLSTAGAKSGRGKRGGGRRKVDLNRGQRLGEGPANVLWPGLNAPTTHDKQLNVQITRLKSNPEKEARIKEMRDKNKGRGRFRRMELQPLQRGWSGAKIPGSSIGQPDPIGEYTFAGFDTRVLKLSSVYVKAGTLGRKREVTAVVITGNKNGLAGIGIGKSSYGGPAMTKAKNAAAKRLQHFDRTEHNSVLHNFYRKEGATGVYVKPMHKGYGLVCHRALKTICEVTGINDIYAKVEGSTKNVLNIATAFFKGLRKQESFQELSDRLKLHVVEYKTEMSNIPVVVASPSNGDARKTVSSEEDLDYERLYFRGKMPYPKKLIHPHSRKPKTNIQTIIRHQQRNQPQCQIERLAYGLEPPSHERHIKRSNKN